ncbi:hypothetical protein [Agrococcus sp. TF02-05]|uniref:hypothetical protein n=1 Tax=Agrococcus sp. TF02-05 TaxID=2815211 RepID=UPI001AA11B30|nr:hypothetical protein [Agrococcus sp. TF02-05]MBO1771072.1 hypothetical protein [Agrococcus sp. TF02-05]
MLQDDRARTVPEPSVWVGWRRTDAEAWAQALLAFPRREGAAAISPMLRLVLWHDWTLRRALPELASWATLAAEFERQGVTADAFTRFHETAGVTPWSPADDAPRGRAAAAVAADGQPEAVPPAEVPAA